MAGKHEGASAHDKIHRRLRLGDAYINLQGALRVGVVDELDVRLRRVGVQRRNRVGRVALADEVPLEDGKPCRGRDDFDVSRRPAAWN